MPEEPASFQIAREVVSALAESGVEHFCVAPGSRSTSLALCAWSLEGATLTVHHDERCAAFFALGRFLVSGRPAAVITTSGTAAAELLPACIEASLSQAAIFLVTADRPRHLRRTGSNQTIRQTGLFGDYVKQAVEVPFLEARATVSPDANLRSRICAAASRCLEEPAGPLHLNVQFERPFEPTGVPVAWSTTPPSARHRQVLQSELATDDERFLRAALRRSKRPLAVVGPGRFPGEFRDALLALSGGRGIPVLADPLSNCRGGEGNPDAVRVETYEALLQAGSLQGLTCDLILRFGGLPVSTRLLGFLRSSLLPRGEHIYVNPTGAVQDEEGAVTRYVRADPTRVCLTLAAEQASSGDSAGHACTWRQAAAKGVAGLEAKLSEDVNWDGAYAAALMRELPETSVLMAGNSLPVRLVDLLWPARRRRLRVLANRGASGIDGQISTALGIASGHVGKTILLTGDVSVLHDLGGLFALRQFNVSSLLIVVLNNDGGGIFSRLPVASMEEPFVRLFVNPHGMGFAELARAFNLAYRAVADVADFRLAVRRWLQGTGSCMLEVRTDWRRDRSHSYDLSRVIASQTGD